MALETDTLQFDLEGSKILMVDDTPANLEILRRTLEQDNYKISIAPSGDKALEIVPKLMPDLILLDVMMPGLDGFETCQKIKNDDSTKDIPILFITAKNNAEDIVKGFQCGGIDYITKPIKYDEVRIRVKTHLELRVLHKQRENLIKKLESANQHLSEMDDLKNKFLGMAAHDLRNPISTVMGFTRILIDNKNDLKDEERDEFLEIIIKSNKHMLALVTDLLDISVIESGNLSLDLTKNSLSDILKERCRLIGWLAENKNIKIHQDFADIPEFPFDSNRISQSIDNLLTNAIKFSDKNTNIYVNLRQDNGMAVVNVRDEGPGISPEDQENLFKGFQKLSSKPTGNEKSTGLGLVIVKKMIESHKGELLVESKLGSGTTFSFKIPTS